MPVISVKGKRLIISWALALALFLPVMPLVSGCNPIVEPDKHDVRDDEEIAESAPKLNKRPFGLAKDFLTLVREEKYEEAYGYLGVDAQLVLSKQAFTEGLAKSLATQQTKNAYDCRYVAEEQLVGSDALVMVRDKQNSAATPWVWEFTEENGVWRIRSLDLPPVSRYQKKTNNI